jgi:hypothetical protein
VVTSWLFKADAVACCTTLSTICSSYIKWQTGNPVNYVENASVLESTPKFLGLSVAELYKTLETQGLMCLLFLN